MSTYTINKKTHVDVANKEQISLNAVTLNSNTALNKDTMAATTESMEFVLGNKTSFTTVPNISTSEESAANYVLINLQDFQNKVWNEIGTPFIVLSNDKGNMEAKVLYSSSMNIGKTSGNASHLQAPLDEATHAQKNNTGKHTSTPAAPSHPSSLLKKKNQTESTVEDSIEQLQPISMASSDNIDTAQSQKHTEDDSNKSYTCNIQGCAKKFTSVNYKRYHQATHNGERLLQCFYEGCGRKFSWPAHLKYHQLTHTGERQYACSSSGCKKTFYTSQRLAVHMRTHTGEKPFQCQEEGCEKAFTTAGNLKNHIRVHTGERPFECNHAGCNRSFAEYSSLRKHKLVHTGEKPFVCYECGKMFSQSGSRTVHVKRHHGILSKKVRKEIEQSASKENSRTEQQQSPSIFVLRNSEDNEESLLQYQEVLTDNSLTRVPLSSSSDGASVMVVSQPQEIISIGSSYHNSHSSGQVTDDIVYDNELLHSGLEQKDPSETINMSPQQHQLHNQTTSVLLSEDS